MFCFGLQSITRFINTNASYFDTHIGWRLKSNFPETLKSQQEKNRNAIHRLRYAGPYWGKLCPRSAEYRGHRPRAVLKTSGTFSPNMDLPASE